MKILKYVLIGFGSVIALLLIIALFIPRQYAVTVSETINRPKQEVFDYVKLIKNQENYSVWVMQDPNVNMEYIGTDGTVGFTAKWNSKDDNVGEGEQQITKLTAGLTHLKNQTSSQPFTKGEGQLKTVKFLEI